jgi:aryl-alcohol dehydrogenase-like predicted oxidoreductase
MKRLVADGLVRHVGVSNHSLAEWQAAESALGGQVLSNQVRFSLTSREPDGDLLPWAQREGRIVIAYSPLGQGLLSGRYRKEAPRNFRRMRSAFSAEARAALEPLIVALGEIARRHGATEAQVALAWLVRKPNVVAIPGASSVQQAEQNAEAANIELGEDDDARLNEVSRS